MKINVHAVSRVRPAMQVELQRTAMMKRCLHLRCALRCVALRTITSARCRSQRHAMRGVGGNAVVC